MQVACVIGRDFAFRILQTITGMREELKSYLINLQGLEFIYEKSLFPELEYIFKHALTQEVAYNSLLLKKRKEIHKKIGQAIEHIYAERLEEFYEMLAYHFDHGEVWDKAVEYMLKAGVKSRKNYAIQEAMQYFGRAKDILEEAKSELRRERRSFRGDVPVGVMVETPSAALSADLIAREVNFFSVGTNDLIQYALAVDRGNERVANLYQPVHPAILRLLGGIIGTGIDRDVEVAVCGELCGEPIYTMLMLGMGLRELSLAPSMLPEIKKVIRSVTMERATEVARTAISMVEASQTEKYLHASLRQVLPMIF